MDSRQDMDQAPHAGRQELAVIPEEWARVKDLFSAAVALSEPDREEYLQAHGDSREDIQSVRDLLKTYEDSPEFLDDACSHASVLANHLFREMERSGPSCRLETLSEPGSKRPRGVSLSETDDMDGADIPDPGFSAEELLPGHFGRYKVLQRLGEGGMGIAYLAERSDGAYLHRVAIKVLKHGPHLDGLIKRFENERQILAGLDHPYIARLIDGGTTSSGQPYYVMEYVAGETVTVYADSHALELRARLKLFLNICEAVAAAHGHLVIHGDIKPANILVSPDGIPKLLDFGLALMIRPASHDVTTSIMMLTPGYASPEQVRGERLSIATDIYSLGVLLFELLTGKSPYGESANSPLQFCRAICDGAPCRPSAVNESCRSLRGDLDHIVLKALRKAPRERYATVSEFQADIQRYLNGFPVEAARGSALYKFRKFVRRRRLLVTLGTVMLTLAAFFVWRIWRAEQIEEIRVNQLSQFAHAMIFDVHDAIQELPGATTARKILIERTLENLKSLEATSAQSRDLKLELARAYTKIGTLQAGASGSSEEDYAAGIVNLEHARSLLKTILARSSNPDDEVALALVDADLEAAGVRGRRGETSEWKVLRAESNTMLTAMAARHPEDYSLRLRAMTSIANTLTGEHNPAAAVEAYRQLLVAANNAPTTIDTRLLQARTRRDMAEELQALGDMRAALDQHRAALAILQGLLADSPANTRFRLETSWAYTETGWVEHEFHDEHAALEDFDRAMELLRAMVAADHGNQLARLEIGKLEITAAETVELADSPARSAENLREALSIFAAVLALDSTNDDVRVNMAQGQLTYANLRVRMAHGNCSAGAEEYRRALSTASTVKDDYPATSVFDLRKLRQALQSKIAACSARPAS